MAGMLAGEDTRPLRVVAFNTAEGWSRDVWEKLAWEIVKRARRGEALPLQTHNFVAAQIGEKTALFAENDF
jgi:hypothetical protein